MNTQYSHQHKALKSRAMILHCMYLGERPHTKLWYQDLGKTLQHKNYLVDTPATPEMYFGSLTTENISERFNYINSAYSWMFIHTLVGHSIGGALALYASQYMPFKKIILVAPYIPPSLDYESIKGTLQYSQGQINIVYEKNDPVVPYSMIQYLISKLDTYQIPYIVF